jgi:hypothetical protein
LERARTASDVRIIVTRFGPFFACLNLTYCSFFWRFISAGVYLHDPRCICKEAKTKTRRKNKEDVVLDALFWPVMPPSMVAAKLDMNRQPHVIQQYFVPVPQKDQYHRHDAAVYSMWMYFVDFCVANADGTSSNARGADAATCYCAPDVVVNGYTDQPRLHVFRFLSSCSGRGVSKEEFSRTTAAAIPAYARHVAIPVAPAQPSQPQPHIQTHETRYSPPTDFTSQRYHQDAEAAVLERYGTTTRNLYASARAASPSPYQRHPAANGRSVASIASMHPGVNLHGAPRHQTEGKLLGAQDHFPVYENGGADGLYSFKQHVPRKGYSPPLPVDDVSRSNARYMASYNPHPAASAPGPATSLSVLMKAGLHNPEEGRVAPGSQQRRFEGNGVPIDGWHGDLLSARTDEERDTSSYSTSSCHSALSRPFSGLLRADSSTLSTSRTDSTVGSSSFYIPVNTRPRAVDDRF